MRAPGMEGPEFDDAFSSEELVSLPVGSVRLVGLAEQTPYAGRHHYTSIKADTRQSSWAVEHNSAIVGDTMSGRESSRSQRLSLSYTPLPAHSRVDSVQSQSSPRSSPHYPLPSNISQPSTPDSSRNCAFVYRDSTSAKQDEYEKLGSATLLKDSVPYFGGGHSEFGRDIDTNAVCRFFTNHRLRRENMTKPKDTDTRNFFTVVNPCGPSTPKRAAKTNNVNYEELDLSDEAPDTATDDDDSDALDGEYTPIKNKGKARPKSVSPEKKKKKKKTPSPPSKAAGKAQKLHAPVYRKHDPTTDGSPPFGVAQAAFKAYNEHVPLKTDLICFCRKPARTNEVLITQCANKDCRIRWYHKDCLSTRGKLQARHGTYLCEQCQGEKYFEELSRTNGWTTEKLIKDEIGMPFTGQEIVETLGNTGNFQAVATPYGLATSAPSNALSPLAQPFTPGTLAATGAADSSCLAVGSEPALGLATSRPYFVTEAYTRAEEHRRIADAAWESAQVYGCYSDEWDEELGEGDEHGEDVTE